MHSDIQRVAQDACITQVAATVDTLLGVRPRADMDAPLDAVVAAAHAAFPAHAARGAQGQTEAEVSLSAPLASEGAPQTGQAAGCTPPHALPPVCDRVFLYHPDAVARWLFHAHPALFAPLGACTQLALPMRSVVPPVTPVCFASMHSGVAPARHGIQKYEKPVLTVDTVFDDLPRAGKRVAIVCTQGDSIAEIFLRRSVDYFIYPTKQACNEKAMELIDADAHDMIVLYNGDYDYWMHRMGPEGKRPLRALRENIATYCALHARIREKWTAHSTVLTFAPDHGCHRFLGLLGTHGADISKDMELMHWYSFLP